MPSTIEIDDRAFVFPSARLGLPSLDANEIDWELELAGQREFLVGTAEPIRGDLHGALLRIDLRSLDALFESLLGRPTTVYPGGFGVCDAHLEARREGDAITLRAEFEFDWDKAIDPPGASYLSPRRARFDIRAVPSPRSW